MNRLRQLSPRMTRPLAIFAVVAVISVGLALVTEGAKRKNVSGQVYTNNPFQASLLTAPPPPLVNQPQAPGIIQPNPRAFIAGGGSVPAGTGGSVNGGPLGRLTLTLQGTTGALTVTVTIDGTVTIMITPASAGNNKNIQVCASNGGSCQTVGFVNGVAQAQF